MRRYLVAAIFVILAASLLSIPLTLSYGNPVMSDMDDYFIEFGQEQTAANNIVTAVVFDYRGFDTLGESVVLFTAVVGVGLLFRRLMEGEEYEDE
jgi:multisubunit Na+/H+ antiporter MnhB subunit